MEDSNGPEDSERLPDGSAEVFTGMGRHGSGSVDAPYNSGAVVLDLSFFLASLSCARSPAAIWLPSPTAPSSLLPCESVLTARPHSALSFCNLQATYQINAGAAAHAAQRASSLPKREVDSWVARQ